MEKNEWFTGEYRDKAETYCASAEHCISEVRDKLRRWQATPEQSEEIIAHLLDNHYIDEARYCKAFVHDKLLYQGWGRVKIRAALQAKHLPSALITAALEDIDEIEYFRILEKVAQKKRGTPEQVMRFCLQRGFTFDEIKRICH